MVDTWGEFLNVLSFLAPVIVIILGVSAIIYGIFVVVFPRVAKLGGATEAAGDKVQRASWPAYIFMAATLGSVMGVLIAVLGGFGRTKAGGEDPLVGALVSTIVVVLAAASSVFEDAETASTRRPMAAISFLLCFLLCGLYWKFIRAANG